jgi:hypothetical protein
VTIIELRVEDITNLSEIYIDNLVIIGDAPVAFEITSVSPDRGGNTGTVTATVRGSGFQPGALVRLREGSQVVVTGQNTFVTLQTRIRTTFDLQGQTARALTLEVVNPSGESVTLPQGFTIEEGRSAQLWVNIVGRGAIRAGRQQTFYIVYGNSGNTDALVVPLWIAGIPTNATLDLGSQIEPPPLPAGSDPIDWDQVPVFLKSNNEIVIPLLIALIPPNATGSFAVTLTVPPGAGQFQLRARINPPYFGSSIREDVLACDRALMNLMMSILNVFPGADCFTSFAAFLQQMYTLYVERGRNRTSDDLFLSLNQLYTGLVSFMAKCTKSFVPLDKIVDAVGIILGGADVVDKCLPVFSDSKEARLLVSPIASFDPNDKIGTRGAGELRFKVGEEPLPYIIYFENLETATAAAQEVVITDQLDTAQMDLTTLSLGPIAFGTKRVIPLPGASTFVTDVDLRPAKNLIVRIMANLNLNTGLMTWRFSSLDPVTGNPPEDPLLGFLPPNKVPPEGEGNVVFTVTPKKGLSTGTEIRNQARILFDTNAPIDTPQWFNTIDNSKPVSRVTPLAAQKTTHSFEVRWSGTDIGSGLQDFTVFVSENGGPFTTWLIDTSATSAIFYGKASTTYAFYSLARDAVGNHESAKTIAEATTTTPPPFQLLLDESGPASNQAAALDSILFLRDPFPIVNGADLLNLGVDRNTRVIIFLTNLQLAQGETSSSVVVNLIDSNNQSYDIAAEDVRPVPNVAFTQVIFRLPNNLPVGTSTIIIKAHGQLSNAGTIRIRI